jgi:hypothetical protein
MAYIGNQTADGGSNSANSPRENAFTAGSDFTARTMWICIGGAYTGSLRLAIYNDSAGAANAKVAETSELTLSATGSWQAISLVTPYSIVNGTVYHLAVESSTSLGVVKQSGGTLTCYSNTGASYPTWPDPFAQNGNTTNFTMAIYATDTDIITKATSMKTNVKTTYYNGCSYDWKAATAGGNNRGFQS